MSGISDSKYNLVVHKDRFGNLEPLAAVQTSSPSSNTIINNTGTPTITTGTSDTIIGSGAGPVITTGSNNTLTGAGAGATLTTGSSNTGTGSGVLGQITLDNYMTAYGHNALGTPRASVGSSSAFGYRAAASVTTGGNITAVGANALSTTTTNSDSTAVGFNALASQTTSTAGNTAVGARALDALTTGIRCVAVGVDALGGEVDGVANIAIGTEALSSAGVGGLANNNIGIGYQAGATLIGGGGNTIVGHQADVNNAAAINRGAFGAGAIATTDNTIQVGANNNHDVQIGKNLILVAANGGTKYTGTITASGATPVTLNTMVGKASFTGVGSIATGGNANLVINNSLVTASTVGMIVFQGGTFAAGSNPVINTITFGAGTITINMINTDDTTATGAAGVFNFSFVLWQL